jgi:signal peptidase II
MAGAMGNCYDRLILGQVRDFVHFHVDSINFDCAIFNFADNMLILGAVVLILFALQPEHHSDAPKDLEETQADGHRAIASEQPEPVHPA